MEFSESSPCHPVQKKTRQDFFGPTHHKRHSNITELSAPHNNKFSTTFLINMFLSVWGIFALAALLPKNAQMEIKEGRRN